MAHQWTQPTQQTTSTKHGTRNRWEGGEGEGGDVYLGGGVVMGLAGFFASTGAIAFLSIILSWVQGLGVLLCHTKSHTPAVMPYNCVPQLRAMYCTHDNLQYLPP